MALSVSPAYMPPANLNLTPSEQKLVPQASTDPAKQALANAGPAAIYHPSEAATTTAQPPEAVDTWVGRSESPHFPRFVDMFNGAQSALKASFQTFEANLAATAPDLASTGYGFTVEADGRLKVLDTAGQLSREATERLTVLLNQSVELKATAVAYRNAAIDMVDAGSPRSGSTLGYYSLTNENFASTIDLAPLLRTHDPSDIKAGRNQFFINQLSSNGERATQETERAMLERRAAQGFSTQA